MDIGAFSDENFDTKEWVNNILKSAEHQEKKENYTMSLVMKLQLYVQQVNVALEQTSQQVLQSLPKIIRDTQNLQQEATLLKQKFAAVTGEIEKIEQDTGESLKTIEKLDEIKNKLSSAKQGLHESDNWAVLANNLEELFDSGDISVIADKLLGMQQSLKLLINVSDYDDRKMQLEGLKNRLEAIASPSIVQAFTTNNLDDATFFVNIFSSIGRLPELIKYYCKCQKDVLLKKWHNQLEIEQDESVTQWVHNYYDILISHWHTQFKWFNQVFPNQPTTETLSKIYADVLTNLNPTIPECIDASLKQISDKLGLLLELKRTTKQFSINLHSIITSQGKLSKEQLLALFRAIFNPLVVYISKYAAYEQANLMQQLSTINCLKEELPDTIQTLGLSVPTVFDTAREAKIRCKEITENCGYCGLLIALRAFFLSYADQYKVALRQLERTHGSGEDSNLLQQLCMSLLQNTGDVLINLNLFEKELTDSILNLSSETFIVEYKLLMLNTSEKKEYESLVKCVTEGTQLSLLDHVIQEFNRLCSDIHHTLYEVIFSPISKEFQYVQEPTKWSQSNEAVLGNVDLPDYSFSPQEYITQIGQYLMTLPQHLEPFLFRENPSLTCALKVVEREYNNASETEGALAEVLLGIIARGTCQAYCDRILSICELSHINSRQLAHDIGYLGNILQDLGLSLTDNLKTLMMLLKLPTDQYQSQSSGYPARYVAAVRQMRNITSINRQKK